MYGVSQMGRKLDFCRHLALVRPEHFAHNFLHKNGKNCLIGLKFITKRVIHDKFAASYVMG